MQMIGDQSSRDVPDHLAASLDLEDPVPRSLVKLDQQSGIEVSECGSLLPERVDAASDGVYESQESPHGLEAWPDVVPLSADWTPPRFPIWVLPSRMREMVQALAEAHAVPVDLPALVALGAVATLTARGVSVQPKPDWVAPANLYVAVVAGVGEAKTPVFNALMGPLYTLESEYRERQAHDLNVAKATKAAAEKAVQRVQDRFAKGQATVADLASAVLAADAVKVPNELRLVTNEPTPEALIQLCDRTGGTVAVVSDEGGEIFQLMSRYVMGGKSNLGAYLKGYDAQPYRSDRVGRDEIIIDRLTLTVALTLQPSVLIEIADDRANRNRGLIGRFLIVQPESHVGYRPSYRPSVPDAVSTNWESLLRDIAGRVLDRSEPVVLSLSPEAERFFNNWFSFIETRLRPDTGDLRYCVDWANKAQGHVLRVAAILHVAQGTPDVGLPAHLQSGGLPNTAISFNTMYAACTLWEYCAEHAINLFDEMGAKPETKVAKKVLRWLVRNRIRDFSQRDAFQAVKGGVVAQIDDLTAGLSVLEEHGYIHPEPAPAHSGPGKPPGPRFAVHPNIGGIGGTSDMRTPGAGGAEGLVLHRDNSIYNSTNAPPHCRLPRSGSTPNTPNIPPEHYVFCVICHSYAAPARQLPEDGSWVGSCCAMRYVDTPVGPVPVDERGRCLICGACDPLVGLDEVCRHTLDQLAVLAGSPEKLCGMYAPCTVCGTALLLHDWWKHADCAKGYPRSDVTTGQHVQSSHRIPNARSPGASLMSESEQVKAEDSPGVQRESPVNEIARTEGR
jgi:hypothetical protein